MLDTHVYQMMLSLHEQLRAQKVAADESVLLVQAMKRSLSESLPGFDATFDQEYRNVASGPLGQRHAATLQQLDELIAGLRKLSQKA